MAVPSDGPSKALTPQEIDAWLCAAKEQCAALHIKPVGRWTSEQLHEAFAEISALLQEAFEEVRVASEALRETSQAVCAQAADLQAHSTKLMERGATVMARMPQFLPPSPEQVQQAERPLLEKFKGCHSPADS
jgi:hypothetical protein